MTRLNLILFLLLIIIALGMVTSQHKARKLYFELQQQQDAAKQYAIEWGQLQLEQSTWANPARVDTLARTRLGLIAPPHDRVRIETLVSAR